MAQCSVSMIRLYYIYFILSVILQSSQSIIRTSKTIFQHSVSKVFSTRRSTTLTTTALNGSTSIQVLPGYLVEYLSNKGTKCIAQVIGESATINEDQIEVVNEAKKSFRISTSKVNYIIKGNYTFGDLLRVQELMEGLKPSLLEKLWESAIETNNLSAIDLDYISDNIFGNNDPIRVYLAWKMMDTIGSVYYKTITNRNNFSNKNNFDHATSSSLLYIPLSPTIVQENIKDRAVLRELKQNFTKVQSKILQKGDPYNIQSNDSLKGNSSILADSSDRLQKLLNSYSEGLKQLVLKTHPWTIHGWTKRQYNETEAIKGREILEYLSLAPTLKNARRLLEVLGVWSEHENIEKYLMQIRDEFPVEVLEEAQYLVDHADKLFDPDERLRRDLRYLNTYSIDGENAAEIDDAISIEYLYDNFITEQMEESNHQTSWDESLKKKMNTRLKTSRVKLWIHIADVSKWIRPGSQLSFEAERRMSAVYLPDKKISMFPDILSVGLLTLGAQKVSYALSCGVLLTPTGEIESFEVCPSKISITRKLTYNQLDEILALPMDTTLVNKELTKLQNKYKKLDRNEQSIESGDEIEKSYLGSYFRGYDPLMVTDFHMLHQWAELRQSYRHRNGALDEYLKHKTELLLSVKRDLKNPSKYVVNGYISWSNSSALSLVSEYMILMSEAVGQMCIKYNAPVWYKVQNTFPSLSSDDLELLPGETPFLRSARLLRHLKSANDSKIPGLHATSGSYAYVQCTSPIRRYHDLYNHYRLKAAMHGASLIDPGDQELAKEEAGIMALDSMATSKERLTRLNDIKLITRSRHQYWMEVYIHKVINSIPRSVFDCVVFQRTSDITNDVSIAMGQMIKADNQSMTISDNDKKPSVMSEKPVNGVFYDAIIMQLGSFARYKLYYPDSFTRKEDISDSLENITHHNDIHRVDGRLPKVGEVVRCHLYRRRTNPLTYLLIDIMLSFDEIPMNLRNQLEIQPQTSSYQKYLDS